MKRNIAITSFLVIAYAATVYLNLSFKNNFALNKNPDIIQNIFGEIRDLVSSWAVIKSEEYYHHGLPIFSALAFHSGESALFEERAQPAGAAAHEHEEEHHGAAAAKQDLFSKVYASVRLTADEHLTASEEKEVLPWFYTAAAFDPHSIKAYLLGGYWLERLGKNAEALKFMKEGEKNNPDCAQILMSIGDLYYLENKFDPAIGYLERARALWKEGRLPNIVSGDDKYKETDRFTTYNLLGDIYEKKNDYEKALAVYKELDAMEQFPLISEKIKTVEEKLQGAENKK